MKKFPSAFMQIDPRRVQFRSLWRRFLVQRLGMSAGVYLNKLHQTVHPWLGPIEQGSSPKTDHDVGASPDDLTTSDQDHSSDWHRFIAAKIEYSFQDKVCVEPGGTESASVPSLERKRKDRSSIECAMVIGITGKD
jgi:hypothetical protein